MYKDHGYSHWINSEKNKTIVKYIQRDESLRMPFIMYNDTESPLKKYLDKKKILKNHQYQK